LVLHVVAQLTRLTIHFNPIVATGPPHSHIPVFVLLQSIHKILDTCHSAHLLILHIPFFLFNISLLDFQLLFPDYHLMNKIVFLQNLTGQIIDLLIFFVDNGRERIVLMSKLLNVVLKLKLLLCNVFMLTVFKQLILEIFALLL
jgi:hypothetical protein